MYISKPNSTRLSVYKIMKELYFIEKIVNILNYNGYIFVDKEEIAYLEKYNSQLAILDKNYTNICEQILSQDSFKIRSDRTIFCFEAHKTRAFFKQLQEERKTD